MLSLLMKATTCIALLLCLTWYGQTHFYRDPGSVFFDKARAYETRYSEHRKAEVEKLINSYPELKKPALGQARDGSKLLCIALSSVKRETHYLPMTIGSIVHGLSKEERNDLHISILIAETDPRRHPGWNHQWLNHAADDIFTYDVNDTQTKHLSDLEQSGKYQEKGVFDYTYALERCYATGALYVGMFEDDIILAEGWFMRILQGLSEISDSGNWLFMRLFNQERSTGWSSREIGGNNEFLIILGIDIGIAASVWLVRRHWRSSRKYLDMETLAVTTLILVPGLIVLLYQSGKASLFPPPPGVFKEPFGCCSQAMIFPRAQVPLVVDSLKERKEGQIDLMLDEIASSNGLDRYALYPVLAQHIGVDSARKTAKDEARAIWSMAFENHNPKTLKKEHNKLLENYELWREKAEQDTIDSMYLDELS
ncbi:hypothetical protein FPRO05_07111 [Fusarium proliferatum]|uniref:Integral membrane protein n=1 Tax=Gibberella intermedia TaxID=948311 RepID=A0A365MJS4_GIBIN|nr:hypothetical protein FPRO05_07111 [Fusarium proliferatum]